MYKTIYNPKTGRNVNINSKFGKKILRTYLRTLYGGVESSRHADVREAADFSKKKQRNNRWSKKGGSHPEVPRPHRPSPGNEDHPVEPSPGNGESKNSSSIIINPEPEPKSVVRPEPDPKSVVPPPDVRRELPSIAPFDPHMAINRLRPFFDIVDRGLNITSRNPEQYDLQAVPFHEELADKINQLLEIFGMNPEVYYELLHRYNNNDNDIIEDYLNFHKEMQKRIFIEAQLGNTFVQEFVQQADQLTLQKASEGNPLGLYYLRGDMMEKLLHSANSGNQWAIEFIKLPHVVEFINGIAQDGNTWANEFIHHVNKAQQMVWVDEFNQQNAHAWVDEFNPQNPWVNEFTQGAPPSTPHGWNHRINSGRSRQLFGENMSQLYKNYDVKHHEKEIDRQKEQKKIEEERQKEIENQKDQDEAEFYFHTKCVLILNDIVRKSNKDSYKKFNLYGSPSTSIPRIRNINDPGFIEAENDELIQSQNQEKSAAQDAMDEVIDEMITGYSKIGISLNKEEIKKIQEEYTTQLNEIHKNIIAFRVDYNNETKRLKKVHDTKIKHIQTDLLLHSNLSEQQLKDIENAYWEGLQKNPDGLSSPSTHAQLSAPPLTFTEMAREPILCSKCESTSVTFAGDVCPNCV